VKILFVEMETARFQDIDHDILAGGHTVERVQFTNLAAMLSGRGLGGMLRAVRKCDLVFIWFANLHALCSCILARILGKPSVVVGGGYDFCIMPEIGYGLGLTLKGRIYAWTVFHICSRIIVNSRSSMEILVRNYRVPRGKVDVIYHGVDVFEEAKRIDPAEKETLAITVGTVVWPNLKLKGIETFVRAAALLPSVRFEVIGPATDGSLDYLRRLSTGNIVFRGWLGDRDLATAYRRARVVVQASHQAARWPRRCSSGVFRS
jgi:glycosyltransferase involved in cell wall biosynthesis